MKRREFLSLPLAALAHDTKPKAMPIPWWHHETPFCLWVLKAHPIPLLVPFHLNAVQRELERQIMLITGVPAVALRSRTMLHTANFMTTK